MLTLDYQYTKAVFLKRPEDVTINPNTSIAITCITDGSDIPDWTLGNESSKDGFSSGISVISQYANGSVTSVLHVEATFTQSGSCCIPNDECASFIVHINKSNEAQGTDIPTVDDDNVTSGSGTISSMPPNEDSSRESYYAFVAVVGVLIGVIMTALCIIFCLRKQHIRKQYDIECESNKVDSTRAKSTNKVELFGATEEKTVVSSLTAESTVKRHNMPGVPGHLAVYRATTVQDDSNQGSCLESTTETVASYPEAALELYEVRLQPADDGADESPRGAAQEQPAGIGQSRPVFTPPDSKPTDQQSTVVSHDFIG